jgi:hypothetical protein
MSDDFRSIVRAAVLDAQNFLRATLSGQQRGEEGEWIRVTLRPIEIKGRKCVQFAYYDAKKCITKNYADAEVVTHLETLLQSGFKNIHVASTTGEVQINISKSGKPLIHRGKAPQIVTGGEAAHDRRKDLLLPEGKPDPYLQAIGFMTEDGSIKADKQRKFRQINEFLKLLQQTGELEKFDAPLIEIVDYGCGNAYLTFAVYHYLNHILGRRARMSGVDLRGDLLEKHTHTAQTLGWSDLSFHRCAIADFVPAARPDITLALHACDTATDEALAQGIHWQSKLIISAPCCHHDLQEQIRRQHTPAVFRPVFRHGILAERQVDILTDSFRALILRIMGYQTEVIQFISPEHTAKNIMIRAIASSSAAPSGFVEEYNQMKTYWQVTPCLETLLGEAFQCRLVETNTSLR